MIIEHTSHDGTTISFEQGHGRFNICKEGKDTRIGHIDGFASDAHFYKFLNDNWPDIADKVYTGIHMIPPDEVDVQLKKVLREAADIKETELLDFND